MSNDHKKSPIVAYLLLIFTGVLGSHRIYLGYYASGLGMLLFTVLGIVFKLALGSNIVLIGIAIWWLADVAYTDKLVQLANEKNMVNTDNAA